MRVPPSDRFDLLMECRKGGGLHRVLLSLSMLFSGFAEVSEGSLMLVRTLGLYEVGVYLGSFLMS